MQRRTFIKHGLGTAPLVLLPGLLGAATEKKTMILENLKVPLFNTTLIGMVKGVSDYYGYSWSDAMLYGGTGHAFMINIHKVLCPSAPYCWNRKPLYGLLQGLGIELTESVFFGGDSTVEDRNRIEKEIRTRLDNGDPCGLVNMEYQLITGYDETGFITTQPWPKMMKFPPDHLAFGTWEEIAKEIHVNFFFFKKTAPLAEKEIIKNGLSFALDLQKNPADYSDEKYTAGTGAYDVWIKGVEDGHGKAHGCWWNAMVWGENRQMAAQWFTEIGEKYPAAAGQAGALSADYKKTAELIIKAADKEMEPEPKIALLRQAKETEIAALGKIGKLAGCF